MTSNKTILFFGGGNMARAIISGLIEAKYPNNNITVIDRNQDKCIFFTNTFQINTATKLSPALPFHDIVILAVKPQNAKEACAQLRLWLKHKTPLMLSLMAGMKLSALNTLLGTLSIVRAMPNLPALIKLGCTGLFANTQTTNDEKSEIEILMSSIGITAWLENEEQMNVITALSGSGPAYFFYLIEQMKIAAIQFGIPTDIAERFSLQTSYGASALAIENNEPINELRKRVTSKKGTTEAALNIFEANDFHKIIQNAMNAAIIRAEELSLQLEK